MVAAIIRHSERPDFRNIPTELWNKVLLTPEGEKVATEFGTALVNESGIPSMNVHGWGLERCIITAEKIAEGARSAGIDGKYSTLYDLQSPIKDIVLYRKFLNAGKYDIMVEDWLSSNNTDGPFWPFGQYSRRTISKVAKEHMQLINNVTVIVTHDLYILPMLNDIFGVRTTEVGFLDGILMAQGGDELDFYSKDSVKRVSKEKFLSETTTI